MRYSRGLAGNPGGASRVRQGIDPRQCGHVEIQERKGVIAVPVHTCQMIRQTIPEEQSIGEPSQLVVERHPENLETARGLGRQELQRLKLLVLYVLRRVRHEYVGDIVTQEQRYEEDLSVLVLDTVDTLAASDLEEAVSVTLASRACRGPRRTSSAIPIFRGGS